MIMIDQFINFVIRPPRADYNPDQYLWDRDFTLAGRTFKRKDLELKNSRDHTLKCSHYVPSPYPEDTPLPCVVYCHGNRADANEAALVLLPLGITVFTLDFSGSGLSDGDYVSLGWHEKDDLRAVVSYLRSNKQVSRIGLWGRSMGAVTSLLYGSEDPSISGMVLDSAFSNLFDLMMEFVDVYKIRLPKFTVKMALQYMRRVIQKKAKFDIMDLNCTQVASKTFIPALFGHADEDKFIQPHHSDLIYKLYSVKHWGKNIIKFSGDHNSSRPQLFYDSVSIFFYNTLYHPQQVSSNCSNKLQMNSKLKDLNDDTAIDESMLYEIITNLRIASTEAASSSSASASFSTAKLVDDALSEIAPVSGTAETTLAEDPASPSDSHFQDANAGEDCCSYTSSARESWDQCSSLGGSDSAECIVASNKEQESVEVSGASEQTDPTKKGKKKKRKKEPAILKKPKSTGFEKLEALGQRIRHHMRKKANLIKRHS